MRLRNSLFLLVIATAVPLSLFSAAVSGWLLNQQYEGYVAAVKDRNRAFMSAVDAELEGHVETLRALSSLRSLQRDDLRAFHENAAAVLNSHEDWVNLILLSPEGRHLVNAFVPWGKPLPQAPAQAPSLMRAVQTQQPAVGDVILAESFQKKAGIPVRFPVVRQGRVVYVLTAIVSPDAFQSLFAELRIPDGWASGLVDSQGQFIARVPRKDVGSKASAPYLAKVRGASEGWYRGPTVEGIDTYTAFTVSPKTGWSVGFAVPAHLVQGSVLRAGWTAAFGTVTVLALALGLAFWLGRRISKPMAELAAGSVNLGRSDNPLSAESHIYEVAELGRALNNASRAILARDEELRRRASQLQAADENKSQFLALLSHELRNPMAPLRTGLAVLAMNPDPQTIARLGPVMQRQLAHLARLTDDLLDVSRIDRGKLEMKPERLALSAVVNGAIEAAKPNIEARSHELVVRYPSDPVYVHGDAVRLTQVLSNLLNNAAKFTPPRGHIEVEVSSEDEAAVVAVSDNGIGIAASELPRIFDMFVQLDSAHSVASGGLGLGLTLARSIVEVHGGRLDARSEGPGKGSRFVMRLPRAMSPAPEVAVGAPTGRPARSRILVVDDNEDATTTLAQMLELKGHEVRVAFNGFEALREAGQFLPDVAFLDLNMPGMDGLELARRLRQDERMRATRLVALTGMGQQVDVANTREAGFVAHLTKPASAEDIERLAGGPMAEVRVLRR